MPVQTRARLAAETQALTLRRRVTGGSPVRAVTPDHLGEKLPGVALRHRGDVLRGALGDNGPAAGAALGAHVDDPVRRLDHVQVVFDDDHRIAFVDKAVDDVQQLADVVEMQAGGRLVEDVDGAPGGALLQLRRPA